MQLTTLVSVSAEPARPVGVRFEGFGWRPVGRRDRVVSDVTLSIEPGERVLLAGPSGAGKSTLLMALTGALGETLAGDLTGSVAADGQIGLMQQNPRDSVVAERIGRDVAFGPENLGRRRADIWAAVDAAAEQVRLPGGRQAQTNALSGGELQRLALAGALAMQPGLLLLDEPTSMLDDDHAASVRAAVRHALDSSTATAIIVEHRLEPWLDLVDRVIVLSRGAVVADTTPEAFVRDYRTALSAQGVWMPGIAAPEPLSFPAELVAPEQPVEPLRANRLGVELVWRRLRSTTRTVALDSVSGSFNPGDCTAVTGPSGSGKSTLLDVLAGLRKPTSGSLAGWWPTPTDLPSRQLAARMGWVPQNADHGLLASSVRQEVELTAHLLGRSVATDAILGLLGLQERADTHPFRLSGGERRRLALAAGLAHRPGLLCLDEPTVGQDRNTWSAVAGWLRSASRAGAAVVASTHDVDLAVLADAQLELRAGVQV